jgi:hypothetical protein
VKSQFLFLLKMTKMHLIIKNCWKSHWKYNFYVHITYLRKRNILLKRLFIPCECFLMNLFMYFNTVYRKTKSHQLYKIITNEEFIFTIKPRFHFLNRPVWPTGRILSTSMIIIVGSSPSMLYSNNNSKRRIISVSCILF